MRRKKIYLALSWSLVAAAAVGGALLLNYWAANQFLSTLAYVGMVAALVGLVNVAIPFRFMGVRKRVVGALVVVGGAGLTFAALAWPASTVRVAQSGSRLDEIMPEYQFSERHSIRVRARPERALEAVRESTFGDLKSLDTLLKIRGAVLRAPSGGFAGLKDKRMVDSFAESGYFLGGAEREIGMFGAFNPAAQRRPDLHTLEEFARCREQGVVKMGFDFRVEDAGDGWSTIRAETRVTVVGDVSRGMARYWRLMVPGSGLLRLQWLDGIKRRAESAN